MNDGRDEPAPRTEGPDADGFYTTYFDPPGFSSLFGPIRSRAEGAVARVRVSTGPSSANLVGVVHGGFLLGFVDQAIFAGPKVLGRLPGHAVTLNVATQFVAPGNLAIPVDCIVEVVSETGRLMFVRGQLEQEGQALLTFQATLRKIRRDG